MPLKIIRNDITKVQCDVVSPIFINGEIEEEEEIRSYYRESLQTAKEKHFQSIAFQLISTGSFDFPKEEGLRIAIDEISVFLMECTMDIYLVVFDSQATKIAESIHFDLDAYIDQHYVSDKEDAEYDDSIEFDDSAEYKEYDDSAIADRALRIPESVKESIEDFDFMEQHESKLQERMKHLSDTFSEYLLYLIDTKGMTNAEVYKRAIVDKKVFSKIKNNPDYHPQKMTCMCLCVGAKLNLDETKDLLARAGYALSPCDKTDVIFSYFIENKIYDMIELDIQLEEHGMKCLIS